MVIILTDCHNSNMVMLNKIVIHGSNHTGNTMFGGNLYIMMFSMSQDNTLRKPTTISISNSNGIGRCLTRFRCSSGGLTLYFIGEILSYESIILINRCKFMSNQAHSGGGISLSMHYVEYTENTHICINDFKECGEQALREPSSPSYIHFAHVYKHCKNTLV